MQNEEEVLLVSFLFSTDHFCWVENDENPDWSKKVRFIQVFFTKVMLSAELECQQKMLEKHENNAYCHIPPPLFFLYTFQVANLKISNQMEHLAMWLAGSRENPRNENAYFGRIYISNGSIKDKGTELRLRTRAFICHSF